MLGFNLLSMLVTCDSTIDIVEMMVEMQKLQYTPRLYNMSIRTLTERFLAYNMVA